MKRTTVGILGGGQLGRMLLQSALDLDLRVHILDPDAQAPCCAIAHQFTQGDLKDFDTVYAFGQHCDVLTIEIEKVNTAALKKLQAEGKRVYPQPEVIELIQDKCLQKQFYTEHGIPTADWQRVADRAAVHALADQLPFVHKLARDGYDGRGVQVIRTADDLHKAFNEPGLIEKMVDIETELAVIVARNPSGEMCTFPVVEMAFHPEANLVEFLFAPAQVSPYIEAVAEELAKKVAEKLDIVGLLAVELFVTRDQRVLVNEVAPRPHNSGHATIEANITSQFEQHLRAILDLPLGDTDLLMPSAMVNVLGEEGFAGEPIYQGLEEILRLGGVHVHLYGKATTKGFRKMGHVTILDRSLKSLREKANRVKETLKVVSDTQG